MPLLQRRSKWPHVKVFRPVGSRYAEGRGATLERALAQARLAYADEFGADPRQEDMVIEIVGVTADWICTVFEIKDEEVGKSVPSSNRS